MNEIFIEILLITILILIISINSSIDKRNQILNRKIDRIYKHLGLNNDEDKLIDEEIKDLISKGKKINAVKLYREHTGLGLKESKEYIDKLSYKNNI